MSLPPPLPHADPAAEHLRLAVELGDILYWRAPLGEHSVHFNERALLMLGLAGSSSGVSRRALRQAIHPEDLQAFAANTDRVLSLGTPIDMVVRFARPHGGWRHVLTRRMVQRSAEGVPLALLGVGLDITDRMLRDQQAAVLSHRIEAASQAAGIGFVSIDAGGATPQWDAQMRQIHGLGAGDKPPGPRTWLRRHVHPADAPKVRRAARDLLRGQRASIDLELRVLRPDGQLRHVRLHAQTEPGNPHGAIVGLLIDETERSAAQRALRAAQERAALVANTVGLGSWEIDLHSRQVTWDERMWRLRGLPPGPAHPAPDEIYRGVHPDDEAMLRQQLRQAILGEATAYYEFRIRWPDGQWRWLASRSVPVRDEEGRVTGRLGLNWDVTDARQTGLARQQKDAAERESRAKSQFLARMSHELRTPLNAVLGFTQMLQADGERVTAETRKRRLEHIRSAGQHLLSLINDVLDLSSLESGELRVQLRPVPLQPLLAETLPLVDRLARQRKVKLRVNAGDGEALADATRLRQVLLNLLTNAIKYNREGGSVTVDTEVRGGSALLRISDTGLGMNDEQLQHVFEPFNRLGRELQDSDGTGIGLAIVKALVERMEGSVHVDSTPGVGSLFELRLRSAGDAQAAAAGQAARPGTDAPAWITPRAGKGPARVLYIEDNVVNALIVQELMNRRPDLALRCAADGTQGVQMACGDPPDLVLVDMQLPDFDGLEVLRRLRAEPSTASIPCIAVSANALRQDIDTALEAGFSEYWTKPLDFSFFYQSLERLFGPAPAAEAEDG